MKNRATDFLSEQEIRALAERSDRAALIAVGSIWAAIAGSMALVALLPHPVTVVFAIIIIGGRQLALAVVMHEGAHRTLARSEGLNEFISQWLGAAPIAQDMRLYRRHHMKHHRHTGTRLDPDLDLAQGYPVSRNSMIRKFLRDLSGLTGLKTLFGTVMMLSGRAVYDVSGNFRWADHSANSAWQPLRTAVAGLWPAISSNLILFLLLLAVGTPELYLLWVAAWLTVYQVVIRVRSIAEHAMTPDPDDALNNSRTTPARLWERALWAPLNVNYHIEHHMLPKVPFYQLPAMHELLRRKGVYRQPASLGRSYFDVISNAGGAA